MNHQTSPESGVAVHPSVPGTDAISYRQEVLFKEDCIVAVGESVVFGMDDVWVLKEFWRSEWRWEEASRTLGEERVVSVEGWDWSRLDCFGLLSDCGCLGWSGGRFRGGGEDRRNGGGLTADVAVLKLRVDQALFFRGSLNKGKGPF